MSIRQLVGENCGSGFEKFVSSRISSRLILKFLEDI
jgi:hypothetical protein